MATDHNDDILLDIFGQQTLPIYTQICFGFPVSDSQSYSHIVKTLEEALDKLYAHFPCLSGRVINEGATADNSGAFKIQTRVGKSRLLVEHLR